VAHIKQGLGKLQVHNMGQQQMQGVRLRDDIVQLMMVSNPIQRYRQPGSGLEM
jgi:hypothetical protein